jgi:hypothetical protein
MRFQKRRAELFTLVAFGYLLAWPSQPRAATISRHCMTGGGSCTANDVSIKRVIVDQVIHACTSPSDSATFTAEVDLQSNASTRYDIGTYINTDGGSANSGATTCSVSDLDVPPASDADNDGGCGDLNSGQEVIFSIGTVTVPCTDVDNDGFLDFNTCVSWAQNSGFTCNGPQDVAPGTGSKCRCEQLNVNIPVPPPATATPTSVPTLPAPTNTPTRVPPTATPTRVPPTATPTLVPTLPAPTNTPTAVPPTATPTRVPPTATPTAVPPTATPTRVPPTATPTAVPPTATPTAVPPTATPTAVPPTATPTAVPPTATPTPTPACAQPTKTSSSRAYGLSLVLGGSPIITPVPDTKTKNPDTLIDIPADPLAHVQVLHVEAENASTTPPAPTPAPDGAASTATANTAKVQLLNTGTPITPNWLVTANVVKAVSTCEAKAGSADCNDDGSVLTNVTVAGENLGTISEPTEVRVNVPGLGTATVKLLEKLGSGANAGVRQPVSGVFSAGLVVNAIHVNITSGTTTVLDLVVAHAEASASFGNSNCEPVPAVSGAGFVVGLAAGQTPLTDPTGLLVNGEVARVDLPSTGGSDDATALHVGPITNQPPTTTLVESNTAFSHTEGTTGPGDTASSKTKSEVQGLRLLDTGAAPTHPLISADVVGAQCQSSASSSSKSSTGSTTLVGLSLGGTDICSSLMLNPLCTPAPNTDIFPSGSGGPVLIRLNEQVCENGGTLAAHCADGSVPGHTGITVNAIHVFVLGAGNPFGLPIGADVVVASATCDAQTVTPTIYSAGLSLQKAPSTMLAFLFSAGAVGLLLPPRRRSTREKE